jgi:hypothetical protein
MISSQGQDQNAQSDQGNDVLIALEKSLSLDDRSSGEACHTNGCGSLDDSNDKEFAHLKVRVHFHDEEVHFPPGAMAAEPLIDAKHQVDRVSDERPAMGRRMLRTVAFGVIASVLVGAAVAWQFYGDDQSKHMVGAGKRHGIVASTKSPNSNLAPVELASKTSDRVPTQDTALLQAAPVLPSAQVSVAPGSSPELQHQLETVVSDVAVVRRIVERLAAVQEQMALDIRDGLQKSDQNARPKVSSPAHSPAAVPPRKYAPSIALPPQSPAAVRPRKYVPSIARSDVVAHSPVVPVPTAPAKPPFAPH